MRTFEIAAIGGFMIAEDTEEHRELFGDEGECVLYFSDAREAAEKSLWAMRHSNERQRMAAASTAAIPSNPATIFDHDAANQRISDTSRRPSSF